VLNSHKALFLVASILSLSLSLPHPVQADLWYEHYAAAEKALSEEQWAVAIEELNSALEKKGDSGARARTYGMKFTAYFPYLKLGIAYYELGQFDAAVQAFETEGRLGAISQSEEESAELDRYRELAVAARGAASADEAARIQSVVEESLANASRFEGEGDVEAAITSLSQALAVSPEDARALAALQRLRSELAKRQQRQELSGRVSQLL
jgi:tetratricopeptide (TPR) repeat protein